MKTLVAIVAALLLGGALAAPAQAALGDNNCITKHEFSKIQVATVHQAGTTRHRAYEIIDTKGTLVWAIFGNPEFQGRNFQQCGHPAGWVQIRFSKPAGKVWRAYVKIPHWAN